MEDINKYKLQNTGGVELLKFAPVEWILDIPVAVDGEISQEIAFVSGTSWLTLEPLRNSADYNESELASDAGNLFEQAIVAVINRSSPEAQKKIDMLQRRKLVFLVYDHNYKESGVPPTLVGNLENWLTFSRSKKTGKQPTNLNHYALMWIGKTFGPSVFYSFV